MLDTIKRIYDNFVFQKDGALTHIASDFLTATVQNSKLFFSWAVSRNGSESLTSLTVRLRESNNSMT